MRKRKHTEPIRQKPLGFAEIENVFDFVEFDGGHTFEPTNPAKPTKVQGGTKEKVDVMAARVELGQPLWHEDDPREEIDIVSMFAGVFRDEQPTPTPEQGREQVIADVIQGRCEQIMTTMDRKFAVVFGDPPFNLGRDYDGIDDRMSESGYQAFTDQWVRAAWNRVEPGGVLFLHGSIKLRPPYWRALIAADLDQFYEGEIAQHFRFCQNNWSSLGDSHCPRILLRKPGAAKKFFGEAIAVESDRKAIYNDKRIDEPDDWDVDKEWRGGRRPPFSVWGIPSDGPYWGRVHGGDKERWRFNLDCEICKKSGKNGCKKCRHDNQLSEVDMQRLVLGYTEPGDWVLDLFGGSGTLGTVAFKLGRPCVTIEQSAVYVESIRRRIWEGPVRL